MSRPNQPRLRVVNLAVPPTLPQVVASKTVETGLSGGKALHYGEGDTLPQVALDAAQDSGTASRCLERRAEFLEGTGFPEPVTEPTAPGYDVNKLGTLGHTPVPGQPGKTANDLWGELCSYAATYNGAALLVRYALNGTIGEVYVLPFQSVRKTDKGTFLLNHKFGRKAYQAGDTTEHPPFDNSPEAVRAVLELADKPKDPKKPKGPKHGQPGQILYIYKPKAGEEDYPLPPHWAGLEDVLADAEYARFDYEEVQNGFFASAVLTLLGEEDNGQEGEDDKTEQDRTDEKLEEFTGRNKTGKGRRKLLVLSAKNKDEAPVLTPFNGTTNLEKLIEKREAVGQIICRNIGIPPILAGFAKAGQLGVSQEIMNAVELTQNSLQSLRSLLVRAFLRVMPSLKGHKPGFKPPISFVPEAVFAKLTTDEIRALGGYEKAKASDNPILEKLQAMSPIVANKAMGAMSREQMLALLGLTPDGNPAIGAGAADTSTQPPA